MMVKSKIREGDFEALDKFLARLEKYNLRLNPKKCVFRVTSGKLLGHIVSERGIEVDPNKIKAIQEMLVSKTEKDVWGFIKKLQYISRFITKLTIICDPFFKLLRKNQPLEWHEECQKAFDKIKKYLTSLLVLKSPRQGKTLILYLALEENAKGAMLAQEVPEGVEHAVYYLSKKFLPYEEKYDLVEKSYLIMI